MSGKPTQQKAERQRRKPGPKPRPMGLIETFEPAPDWEAQLERGMNTLARLIARRVLAKRAAAEETQEQEQAS